MECWTYQHDEDYVRRTGDTLTRVLNPVEPLVMRIQSLLVWEYPRRSAVLFLCAHGIFWFFATIGCKFYFLVSTTTFIVYVTHTWKHKIWPEIRVPPKVPEDPDSWTPVHPRLLSVPELCQYLAQIWCSFTRCVAQWLNFRRNYPFLFCVVSSTFFIVMAITGRYISGLSLMYITVISTMLWPSVLYHNLVQRVYLKFEPVFMRLDYSIKLKSKWSFKGKKSEKSQSKKEGTTVDTDSDSDFTPSLDPETTAALARAITDSEDESGTPSISTPLLSKEPSIELNDDEDRITDFEADFTSGISEMPSIDDALDHTDDELLDPVMEPKKPKHLAKQSSSKDKEDINFVSEHFGDSSDSEDETLITGLNFNTQEAETEDKSIAESEAKMASAARGFVSSAFSMVMNQTLSGFSALTKSSTVSKKGNDSAIPASVAYNTKDEVDFSNVPSSLDQQSSTRKRDSQRLPSEDTDFDITDEFEFLDQYDIDEDNSC